jgi:hypothetical protein
MHSQRKLAFDLLERHFLCFAPGLAFPGRKQLSVRLFDVAFDGNVQALGGGVNPFGMAFDFAKVADGRFVDYDMAVGVGPFTAELFIAEAGAEADRFNDPVHGFAVLHLRFNLPAGLVSARLLAAAIFIGQRPARAILAKAEQGSPAPKLVAGLIKEGIHLMGAGGDQAESSRLEARGEGINVVDSELDLDFAVGSHTASIKKQRCQDPLVVSP